MPTEKTKDRKPSKRLTDIDVSEVSLVDRPANEEEFKVIKRKEGAVMSDNTETKPKEEDVTKTEGEAPPSEEEGTTEDKQKVMLTRHGEIAAEKIAAVKKLAEEISTTDLDVEELHKRVCSMNRMLWQLTDAVDVVQTLSKSLSDVVEDVEKQEYGKDDNKKLKAAAAALKQIAGIATKAMNMVEARMAGKPGEEEDYQKPTRKGVTLKWGEDGAVEISGLEDIEKGKRFTPARKEAVKTAVSALLGMVKDMDPDAFGTMMKELGIEQKEAAAKKPDKEEEEMEEGKRDTKKLEEVEKELADTKEKVEALTKRLEEADKTRGTPSAIPQDGTSKPVEKQTSIWDGIL